MIHQCNLCNNLQQRIDELETIMSKRLRKNWPKSIEPTNIQRMKRAVEYIHKNYTQNISLKDMADQACFSPFHFTRKFKSIMNIGPHAYLHRLRIIDAAALLKNTDMKISQIAITGISIIILTPPRLIFLPKDISINPQRFVKTKISK